MTAEEFLKKEYRSIVLIMLSVGSLWLLLAWLIWVWVNVPRCDVCNGRIKGPGVEYNDMVMCDRCWDSQVRIWRECNPDHK